MNRVVRGFYINLSALVCLSCVWQIVNLSSFVVNGGGLSICLLRRVVGIPCAGCGTTRGVLCLLEGNFEGALMMNPLSYLLVALWVLVSVLLIRDWLCYDVFAWRLYLRLNLVLSRWYVVCLVVVLTVLNWVWNIQKGY